jgi:hypothetical protein
MKHALVKLARTVDWGFLEQTFGAVYTDKPGQPPLPTRLMAGLAILKPHLRPFRRGSVRSLGGEFRTSGTSAARNFSNMRWCSTIRR